MKVHSRLPILLLLAALTIFVTGVWYYWFYTVEDAYISFRYCDHMISGKGLQYNPGDRVEGYTNFLWILVIAPFRMMLPFPAAAKIPGIISAVILLILLYRSSRDHEHHMVTPGPIAALLVSVSPGFQLWAVAGLETILFTTFLTAAVYLHENRFRYSGIVSGAFFGIATMTRPEGALFFVVFILSSVLTKKHGNIRLYEYILGFCMVVLPHQMFRVFYYHSWIPNTFWVKSHRYQGGGLAYFKRYLAMTGIMMIPIGFLGLCWKRVRPEIFYLLAMPSVYLIYVFAIGGDWMPFGRFLIPTLPFFALAAARTVSWTPTRAWSRFLTGLVLLHLIVATVSVKFDLLRWRPSRYLGILSWEAEQMTDWQTVGIWMRQHLARDTTICTGLAGILPYYSELRTIDTGGLNDKEIARVIFNAPDQSAEQDRIDEIILRRQPDIVMVEELSFQMLRDDERIPTVLRQRSPEFLDRYTIRTVSIDNRFFSFYLKKNKTIKGLP